MPSASGILEGLGSALMPSIDAVRGTPAERRYLRRAAVAGIITLTVGVVATAVAVTWAAVAPHPQTELAQVLLAALLAAISVFAPPAVFRTRSAVLTEEVLSNPLGAQRPWRATTLTFDPALTGAMIAALTVQPILAAATFSVALVLRTIVEARPTPLDPNAGFHALWRGATTGIVAAGAYATVYALRDSVLVSHSLVTLILGALIGTSLTLGLNALERWVEGVREQWAFAVDAADTRRLAVIGVSALIAWAVSGVLDLGRQIQPSNAEVAGELAADGMFLAAWLLLWFVSIRLWRHDALRAMRRWAQHQTDVLCRIADGSLDPELARRASVAVTARMALTVFGATHVLVAVRRANGEVIRYNATCDAYRADAAPDPRAITAENGRRIALQSRPGHADSSDITFAGAIGPAPFVSRSRSLAIQFQQLAAAAILTPVVALQEDRLALAFEEFYGPDLWPTMEAFAQAFERLRARTEGSPQSRSLLIGVLAIDAFGALTGGRFEHAAVAQVMRLTKGFTGFTGQEVFVAYEGDGRVWIALGGGPIVRNGIGTLRDLQRHIEEQGSVSAAHSDLEVHVEVSLGYAVQQVDDFALAGLMDHARQRLEIDMSARNPFEVDAIMSIDITPEDIIGVERPPMLAVDVSTLLREDVASEQFEQRFPAEFAPVVSILGNEVAGVSLGIGWDRRFGAGSLEDPGAFLAVVNRRPDLAADAARITLARAAAAVEATDTEATPILATLPPVLLHPDIGEMALPNLITPIADRATCARLVAVFDTIPTGSQQALRMLSDRGVRIAVTASAAATADPADLDGWQRWGVLLPQHMVDDTAGVDFLAIQQTVAAIATRDTRLVAEHAGGPISPALIQHGIGLVLRQDRIAPTFADALHGESGGLARERSRTSSQFKGSIPT